MKKLKFLCLLIVAVLCVSIVAACTPTEEKQYTVTYYDGERILKTENVKEGEKPNNWTPVKEDYKFEGWWATPSFSHAFNFDNAITSDVSVFSQWSSISQTVDTRTFYIVGAGTSPILSASNWGKVFDDTTKMIKNPDKNEYTYTLDLYKDDLFQFALNESWHNQRGVGYIKEFKLADGTLVFSGASTIGDASSYRLNIKCELAGNYTFTLTTHPDDDTYETSNPSYTEKNKECFNINTLDTITWVRNGDVNQEVDIVTDYYIKGSGITKWNDMYNAATKMTNNDGVYTLEIYLKADEEFMFTSLNTINGETTVGADYLRATNLNEAGKEFIGQTESFNMKAKKSGTYVFTYTAETKILSVAFDENKVPELADYYLDGTFSEGVADWSGYCFTEQFKLNETDEAGIIEIKNIAMKAQSQFIIQAFKQGATERGEWGTDTYTGLGSYNYTYLYYNGEAFSVVGNGNNNIMVLEAGSYDITFNSYAKIITITEHIESNDKYDIYIKGENINSWDHKFSAEWKFIISADEKSYEFVLTIEENITVNFGLAKYNKGETTGYGDYIAKDAMGTNGDANNLFMPESGTNFTCSKAGKYKIVYDIETGKVDFYIINA